MGMTVAEVAERLTISRASVHQLLRSGHLTSTGRVGRAILVDPASVERIVAAGTRRGRAWTAQTAWGALAMLSGQETQWLTTRERYRIREQVSNLSANDVYLLSRNRAATARYRAVPEAVPIIDEYLMRTGGAAMRDDDTATRFGLAGGGGYAAGYVLKGDAAPLTDAFGLVDDPQGNVTIHEIEFGDAFVDDRTPVAAIAVDLLGSLSTRERSAGTRVLEELLRQHQGTGG